MTDQKTILLAAVKVAGKWGYIDNNGRLVIAPQFDEADHFTEGMAAVRKGNKWGFINYKGLPMTLFDFDEVTYFNRGIAAAKKNGKWGAVGKKGAIVNPFSYQTLEEFKSWSENPMRHFNEVSSLKPVQESNLWTFLNETGEKLTPPRFDEVKPFYQFEI